MAKYIPEQHYLGLKPVEGSLPLGFITPEGTDKAAENRKSTVTHWATGYGTRDVKTGKLVYDDPDVKTIDNKSMTGFKIAREVRRWTTSNVVWRLEDPRGFELEISSGNMAYLISNCILKNGEIQDELIWTRDGANNFLLPVDSEEYNTYKKYTKVRDSGGIKITDGNIGNKMVMANGDEGIYIGRVWMIDKSYLGNNQNTPFLKAERVYAILEEGNWNPVATRKSMKNATILEDTKLTPEEALDKLNSIDLYYTVYSSLTKIDPMKILENTEWVESDKIKDENQRVHCYIRHDDKIYLDEGYRMYEIIFDKEQNTMYSKNLYSSYNSYTRDNRIMESIRNDGIRVKLETTFNGNKIVLKED